MTFDVNISLDLVSLFLFGGEGWGLEDWGGRLQAGGLLRKVVSSCRVDIS